MTGVKSHWRDCSKDMREPQRDSMQMKQEIGYSRIDVVQSTLRRRPPGPSRVPRWCRTQKMERLGCLALYDLDFAHRCARCQVERTEMGIYMYMYSYDTLNNLGTWTAAKSF